MKAPLVFGLAAALLALSWVWVAGTEWSGRRSLAAVAHIPDAAGRAAPASPSLPDVKRLLGAVPGNATTGSVFHSTTIDRYMERLQQQRKADEEARRKAEAEAEARRKAEAEEEARRQAKAAAAALAAAAHTAAGDAAKPVVKEPPPKPVYAVTYNGLVTTADRQEVGIIGIAISGPREKRISLAVAPGDACLNAVVTALTRESVTIRLKKGEEVLLKAGETQRFEDPLLHGH